MNISNLWVIISKWNDGHITFSLAVRGKEAAFHKAMRMRDVGNVASVEIVSAREAARRMIEEERV